ncbi:unnamed protein product [Rhodiola kirilowii]
MESMKGQGGIQQLLNAEQEAQQIVAAARNLKMTRLRQAKEEAEQEVAQYRRHLEEEYQKSISESSGNSGSNVKRLEDETATKIEKLKETQSKVSSDVVSMLLKYVTSVRS